MNNMEDRNEILFHLFDDDSTIQFPVGKVNTAYVQLSIQRDGYTVDAFEVRQLRIPGQREPVFKKADVREYGVGVSGNQKADNGWYR